MKYLIQLLIFPAIFLSTQVFADGNPVVAGAGSISCGRWIESRAMKNEAMDSVLATWLQGFLSGMNAQRFLQTKQDMLPLPDSPSLLAYIDKACGDKPLDKVYPIAVHLYGDLQSAK